MSARLLIVEDEPETREMLARHYRDQGYDVALAADGREALPILAAKRIEVVISDLTMEGMHGVELLKTVRTEYPMVHVIMITGHVTLENALACMRRGADTCVFKPLTDLTELDGAVARSLEALARWQDKLRDLRNWNRSGEAQA
jgi:DNA-binding NtrC family response regulator